jgi:hypothetical protein
MSDVRRQYLEKNKRARDIDKVHDVQRPSWFHSDDMKVLKTKVFNKLNPPAEEDDEAASGSGSDDEDEKDMSVDKTADGTQDEGAAALLEVLRMRGSMLLKCLSDRQLKIMARNAKTVHIGATGQMRYDVVKQHNEREVMEEDGMRIKVQAAQVSLAFMFVLLVHMVSCREHRILFQ